MEKDVPLLPAGPLGAGAMPATSGGPVSDGKAAQPSPRVRRKHRRRARAQGQPGVEQPAAPRAVPAAAAAAQAQGAAPAGALHAQQLRCTALVQSLILHAPVHPAELQACARMMRSNQQTSAEALGIARLRVQQLQALSGREAEYGVSEDELAQQWHDLAVALLLMSPSVLTPSTFPLAAPSRQKLLAQLTQIWTPPAAPRKQASVRARLQQARQQQLLLALKSRLMEVGIKGIGATEKALETCSTRASAAAMGAAGADGKQAPADPTALLKLFRAQRAISFTLSPFAPENRQFAKDEMDWVAPLLSEPAIARQAVDQLEMRLEQIHGATEGAQGEMPAEGQDDRAWVKIIYGRASRMLGYVPLESGAWDGVVLRMEDVRALRQVELASPTAAAAHNRAQVLDRLEATARIAEQAFQAEEAAAAVPDQDSRPDGKAADRAASPSADEPAEQPPAPVVDEPVPRAVRLRGNLPRAAEGLTEPPSPKPNRNRESQGPGQPRRRGEDHHDALKYRSAPSKEKQRIKEERKAQARGESLHLWRKVKYEVQARERERLQAQRRQGAR